MRFTLSPMTEGEADDIAAWHYAPPYDFYDAVADEEDLAELLDPASWVSNYHSVKDERGALVGFFSFKRKGSALVIGLGLRPDLTGRGLGRAFVRAGLGFARAKFHPELFVLDVATFNERARRVYEAVGFEPQGPWQQTSPAVEFLRMTRPADGTEGPPVTGSAGEPSARA
jgi:ribosomal-protein-alanine N-acetyltransferase